MSSIPNKSYYDNRNIRKTRAKVYVDLDETKVYVDLDETKAYVDLDETNDYVLDDLDTHRVCFMYEGPSHVSACHVSSRSLILG